MVRELIGRKVGVVLKMATVRTRFMKTFKPRLKTNCSYYNTGNKGYALTYHKYGDPEEELQLLEVEGKPIGNDEVEVHMLMAPINPSDINQIQGTYPIRPTLPAVGGNEGVGVVRKCGQDVKRLSEGDKVIPIRPGIGTWCSTLRHNYKAFLKIPQNVPDNFGATLQVNPPTAYRMLKDFVKLQPGDTIIQNGANSAVGQAVIQLAALWGINTINIIRERPFNSQYDVVKYLKRLGGTEIITEEFLASIEMKELIKNYSPPKLALNCVGGSSSGRLARQLGGKGVMVTYGGMSKKPVTIATSSLIFKEIQCVGYWNGLWLHKNVNNWQTIVDMYNELCTYAINKELVAPRCVHYSLQQYKTAISNATKPFVSSKQLFEIN